MWQTHQFMQQHRIRRLVVDEGRYLAGILTQSILLHALYPNTVQLVLKKPIVRSA